MSWVVVDNFVLEPKEQTFEDFDEAYTYFANKILSKEITERISWFGQSYIQLYEEKND